jgi:hypothetical protein
VELNCGPCADDPLAVLIYPEIPGLGYVAWLPALKLAGSEKIADILRETDPFQSGKVHREPVSRPPDAEPRKGGFPKKPESKLIPGRAVR